MAFRASEILDLLEVYQGVVCTRPLEMGNLDFLQCLLSSSRRLGEALHRCPRNPSVPPNLIKTLSALLDQQKPSNGKRVSERVLRLIKQIRNCCESNAGSPPLYVKGFQRPLTNKYARIILIFGPALGLGDQITFLQFLKALFAHCAGSRLTIFTLYPNLWPQLLPRSEEVSYREAPLRPFIHLAKAQDCQTSKETRELVVVCDFECFNLHRKIIPQRRGRDILEIALGRRAAWLNMHGSPWIQFEDFSQAVIFNNYWILSDLASRLMPKTRSRWPWQPIRAEWPERKSMRRSVLLLNPFTSKDFSLEPEDWKQVLQNIRALLPKEADLQVLVYPGIHPSTIKYSQEICRLSRNGGRLLSAHLLPGRAANSITPYSALPTLARSLRSIDLCVTVDTFASHFVPLFRIPTIVVTHRDNREFWVPSGWSFYCLLGRMQQTLPFLVSCVLSILSRRSEESRKLLDSAKEMVSATVAATEEGLSHDSVRIIQGSLAEILRQTTTSFPFREQAMRWLLFWSRLAAALNRQPVHPEALQPYVCRWRECEFFKLVALYR